jgi:hypothetical protein
MKSRHDPRHSTVAWASVLRITRASAPAIGPRPWPPRALSAPCQRHSERGDLCVGRSAWCEYLGAASELQAHFRVPLPRLKLRFGCFGIDQFALKLSI